MHTGTKIKELRKLNKMTQEELGELLGVKKAAIQKYEKGEIINLKLHTIKKLCEVFHETPAAFIFPEAERYDQQYNSKQLHFEVKALETIEDIFGPETISMIDCFTKLNDEGKCRAIDIIEDLAMLDKYAKSSR